MPESVADKSISGENLRENCKVARTLRRAVRQVSRGRHPPSPVDAFGRTQACKRRHTTSVDVGRPEDSRVRVAQPTLSEWRGQAFSGTLADGTTECVCYLSCRNRTLQFPWEARGGDCESRARDGEWRFASQYALVTNRSMPLSRIGVGPCRNRSRSLSESE